MEEIEITVIDAKEEFWFFNNKIVPVAISAIAIDKIAGKEIELIQHAVKTEHAVGQLGQLPIWIFDRKITLCEKRIVQVDVYRIETRRYDV